MGRSRDGYDSTALIRCMGICCKTKSGKDEDYLYESSGKSFNTKCCKELKNEERLIIICGHYEGIDERVLEEIVDMEISIGDYVLTGGAACHGSD